MSENPYMNQLHKNRLQIAEHRPGLNVKTQLLFKITAKGDLEIKEKDTKRDNAIRGNRSTRTPTRKAFCYSNPPITALLQPQPVARALGKNPGGQRAYNSSSKGKQDFPGIDGKR